MPAHTRPGRSRPAPASGPRSFSGAPGFRDPRLREIYDLRERSERERTARYFIEGIRFVAQAIAAREQFETAVTSPELLTHPFGRKLLRQLRNAGVPSLEVSATAFQQLARSEEHGGIGAVVRQRVDPLWHARPDAGLCWVAVSTIQSAGNLGTLIRTCAAVGAAGLILIDSNADPYDPGTVRATMGALFNQRIVRATSAEFRAWKQRRGCTLIGTSPSGAADYHGFAYSERSVLFLGSEKKGLSAEELAMCDRMVRIPMVGDTDSLNLVVAGSVLLYELFNQRRSPGK